MVDYEETREDSILALEKQIKQLVKDAFDKGYQCGYHDYRAEPTTEGYWNARLVGYQDGVKACNEEWFARLGYKAQYDEPQTTDYCDVCNHKGCETCAADGSNPYCVPSQYEPKDEPQTERSSE